MKEKKQETLPHHPNTDYDRYYQLRYDARIKLDAVVDEAARKLAIVIKFKAIFKHIMEEESSVVLYPHSTLSSAVLITAVARLPNTYMYLKWYVPSLNSPKKNSDIVYCQMYVETNIMFDDWKSNLLKWTKEEGHGIYLKCVQDERIKPVGYLLYTHKMSNAPWYQTTLSKKCGIPIAARFEKYQGKN